MVTDGHIVGSAWADYRRIGRSGANTVDALHGSEVEGQRGYHPLLFNLGNFAGRFDRRDFNRSC